MKIRARISEGTEVNLDLLIATMDAVELAAGVGLGQRAMETDVPSDMPGRLASLALIVSYDEDVRAEVVGRLLAMQAGGKGKAVEGAGVPAAVCVCVCLIVRLALRYPAIRLRTSVHYVLLRGRVLLHQRVAVSRS